MNRTKSRHSSLFLLELVAAIFFFCLASAVCVRFFVKSHTLSVETKNLDMAANYSSSFAEVFRSDADFFPILALQYPDAKFSEDNTECTLFYDVDWTPCAEPNKSFCIIIQTTSNDDFCTAKVVVLNSDDDRELYTLTAGKHMREGAND